MLGFKLNTYIQSSNNKSRRRIEPNSLPIEQLPYNSNQYDLLHSGFVVVTSAQYLPMAGSVFLSSVPNDPRNNVDIWYYSYESPSSLLLKVTQISGNFTPSNTASASMPSIGWTRLDMYQNNLTQIYKNQYNN